MPWRRSRSASPATSKPWRRAPSAASPSWSASSGPRTRPTTPTASPAWCATAAWTACPSPWTPATTSTASRTSTRNSPPAAPFVRSPSCRLRDRRRRCASCRWIGTSTCSVTAARTAAACFRRGTARAATPWTAASSARPATPPASRPSPPKPAPTSEGPRPPRPLPLSSRCARTRTFASRTARAILAPLTRSHTSPSESS
ncbi:hypothetical protein ANANG_G00089810 [Anguilla anguilla]|uniref:Uncharacterized protein n=1 Tax=Anguilla anguilla TaxID=7936 RepID=A0A9D3MNJ6_ANGAN|nr:hypothetical protein ANANG_G00089810 [Anguilla anguilla]